jgi:hypothetical protein
MSREATTAAAAVRPARRMFFERRGKSLAVPVPPVTVTGARRVADGITTFSLREAAYRSGIDPLTLFAAWNRAWGDVYPVRLPRPATPSQPRSFDIRINGQRWTVRPDLPTLHYEGVLLLPSTREFIWTEGMDPDAVKDALMDWFRHCTADPAGGEADAAP